ncbi:hypothetical protein E2562_028710 [Oryza meyeriana var. granulata]|uniref:Uncharacterized protein n=1 Tax=Oryza meyeriana var. granulata TaxID=110450 RepID=A0A6G1CJ95_9ORYZ|nr:hypothetical protein E2562_028710 [Oryza meyeriana var. granulata]
MIIKRINDSFQPPAGCRCDYALKAICIQMHGAIAGGSLPDAMTPRTQAAAHSRPHRRDDDVDAAGAMNGSEQGRQ